jgi:CDP-diglyceride synthetase
MKTMGNRWASLLLVLGALLGAALCSGGRPADDHRERGDVPGWVMITLMSAVLVAALLALAGPALESMFNRAMDTVGS